MTDNINQEKYSFENLFEELQSAMVNDEGEIFYRTVLANKEEIDEEVIDEEETDIEETDDEETNEKEINKKETDKEKKDKEEITEKELNILIDISRKNIDEEDKKELEKAIEDLTKNNNEELNIIANALKENATEEDKDKLREIIANTLKENATEKDKKKLDLITDIIGENIFRYRFEKKDEDGNIEKYEYSFHKDRMVVIIKDKNNKIIEGPMEFEYGKKEYSNIFFPKTIIGLCRDKQESIFFKKNNYNLSIANTILRYYIKNGINFNTLGQEYKNNNNIPVDFATATISYIERSNLIYSETLMRVFAEAGMGWHFFKTFDEKRGNIAIANIEENAAIGGNGDLIHYLEQEGIKVATVETLKVACSGNNLNVFNYLAFQYLNLNEITEIIGNEDFMTNLFNYIYHPRVAKEIFGLFYNLIENKKNEENKNYCLIKFFTNMISGEKLEITKFLFKILFEEIFQNNKKKIEKFVNFRFLPSQTFIDVIISRRYNGFAKFLFQQPIVDINRVNCYGNTPLNSAIREQNIEIIEILLQQPNIDVNKVDNDKKIPLHLAIEKENIKIIELLLQNPRIDVNIIDKFGKTPLHLAIEKGDIKIIEILLQQPNIDINKINFSGGVLFSFFMEKYIGITPLHLAIEKENIKIIELLLQRPEIEINKKDRNNKTPLHLAVENGGNIKITELLLQQPDINVNISDIHGKAPLDIAIRERNIEIINLLLQHPDLNVSNEKRQSIFDLAIEKGNLNTFICYFNKEVLDISVKSNNIKEKEQKIKNANIMLSNIKGRYNLNNNIFRKSMVEFDRKFKKSLNDTINSFEEFLNNEKKSIQKK